MKDKGLLHILDVVGEVIGSTDKLLNTIIYVYFAGNALMIILFVIYTLYLWIGKKN